MFYGIGTISSSRVLALFHFTLVVTSLGTMKGCFAQHHGNTLKDDGQLLQEDLWKEPKAVLLTLDRWDHPELDDSPLLDVKNMKIYQSLIRVLQWVIQIGRFDITTMVMMLLHFRAAPREGHMDRVKCIHGYLAKYKHGTIRINPEEPDYSGIPKKEYNWMYTCYPGAKEEIPKDIPKPLGKGVVTTSYIDANLYHDLISGRLVMGILHLINKTPINWTSKLQTTMETATFGSEYVTARTCTEQIIDLCQSMRYLGVPINGESMMFRDNELVVNTASILTSRLSK
jgi:hypothetical protein